MIYNDIHKNHRNNPHYSSSFVHHSTKLSIFYFKPLHHIRLQPLSFTDSQFTSKSKKTFNKYSPIKISGHFHRITKIIRTIICQSFSFYILSFLIHRSLIKASTYKEQSLWLQIYPVCSTKRRRARRILV